MKTLVIYESMFGNTHQVATAIGDGAGLVGDVTVVQVHDVTPDVLSSADLVLVGAPTHVHGLPRAATREEAARMAASPDATVHLEPGIASDGVREWLESAPEIPRLFGVFDTRADAFKWLTGSAAHAISRALAGHHRVEVVEAGSFLAPDNDIDLSELTRAREWGAAAARSALESLAHA